MLRDMLVSNLIIETSFSIFCTFIYYLYLGTHILCVCVRVCVTTIVFSMGNKFVNTEEIVSGTRSEDSVTPRLSSLRVFTSKCIVFVSMHLFFLLVKKLHLLRSNSFSLTTATRQAFLNTILWFQ